MRMESAVTAVLQTLIKSLPNPLSPPAIMAVPETPSLAEKIPLAEKTQKVNPLPPFLTSAWQSLKKSSALTGRHEIWRKN